jgi:subtilisin family serine protease
MGAANYVTTTHQGSLPAVANVSIGGNSDALYNLLKSMVDDGIFVAVAAGNSQPGSSPVDACTTTSAGRLGGTAGYPGLMVVGATSIYGYQAFYSYFGNCVNVWAPGGDFNYPIATSVGTTLGTSMSAPEVAGAAVLLYSWYPTWRPGDIWAQIKYFETIPYGGLTTLHIPLSTGCTVTSPPGYNPNCPPNCVTQ